MARLNLHEVESIFKTENFLRHVDYIFDRVFGKDRK